MSAGAPLPEGSGAGAPLPEGSGAADPRRLDHFLVRQRYRLMVNQYEVSTLAADGRSPDRPVCFVQQKRVALKEDLRAYVDDTKQEEVFRIKARQVWDPRARYTVTDPTGRPIGELGKVFGSSLLRSTWKVFDPAGQEIAWAQERSLGVALFRRFAGFIPFVGGLLELIPIPYHFDYHAGERQVGGLRRLLGLRDRYVLDLSGDAERTIDRRLGVALAVGMDAMQAR